MGNSWIGPAKHPVPPTLHQTPGSPHSPSWVRLMKLSLSLSNFRSCSAIRLFASLTVRTGSPRSSLIKEAGTHFKLSDITLLVLDYSAKLCDSGLKKWVIEQSFSCNQPLGSESVGPRPSPPEQWEMLSCQSFLPSYSVTLLIRFVFWSRSDSHFWVEAVTDWLSICLCWRAFNLNS